MAAPDLDPALRIRVLQRGLAEGLWGAPDLGLGHDSDLFSIQEQAWLTAFEALDQAGRIPETLKREVFHDSQEATRFLDSGPQTKAFPTSARTRFEPLGFLGDGGMGSVFKAFDRQLGRVVALKFLKHLDDEARQRFLQEIRAQAQIEHAHIVRIFEAGEFDGNPYLAMQFVDGPTLGQAIPLLNLEQKVRVVRDAAEALQACHRQGVLHRDIKPSNIMLDALENGQWHGYVMDFGLARVTAEESRTQAGFLMGTPAYLSPEQASGEPFDRRSDIYSLGTTLYECLSGEPPFSAHDTWELLRKIVTEEPPSLRRFLPSLPRDLELIIAKAMDKDPLRRYASARAFSEDLSRFLDGDPVQAQPPTLRYRSLKLLRKHRHLVWVVGVSLGLMTCLAAWGLRTAWTARRTAQAAQAFGAGAEAIESLLFKAYSLPLHDTRAERAQVHARMAILEEAMVTQGKWSRGPGHFALGRGHLALGELERAKVELEKARAILPHDPAVAQALGLVLAQLYAQELEGLRGKQREERKLELEKSLRTPALALIQEAGGRGLEVHSYPEAMVALVEERTEDAIAKAREAQAQAPWFYQAWVLEGRAHRDQAAFLLSTGQFTLALERLEAAGRAFAEASERARSAPEPYVAEAQRRLTLLRIRFDRAQLGEEDKAWALEAVAKARMADPDGWQAWQFASAIHRQWALRLQAEGKSALPDLERSIAEAQQGLQHDPASIQLLINLATGLRSKADEESLLGRDPRPTLNVARETLQKALAQPRFREFLLDGLGNCHLMEALYAIRHGLNPIPILDQGIKALEESNALHPWVGHLSSLGEAWTLRGQFERWRGEDPSLSLRRAEAVLQQALHLNRNSFQTRLARAQARLQELCWLLERGQESASALQALREEATEALRLNPSLGEARGLLALAYLAQAEASGAAAPLKAAQNELAMALAQARVPFEIRLAEAQWALSVARMTGARAALGTTLQGLDRELGSRPAESGLWLMKGRLLEALGRKAEADQAFAEAVRLNANYLGFRDRPKAFPG